MSMNTYVHIFISMYVYIERIATLLFSEILKHYMEAALGQSVEKVAETCEFDGKEPLFVERTMSISNRVLG